MDYANLVPARILESINAYVLTGRPVGHFLTAVLTNDLMEAVGRADDECKKALPVICQYLYNRMPACCKGSKENVVNWMENGGAEGQGGVDKFEIDLVEPAED